MSRTTSKKSLGQNFLVDNEVVQNLVNAADIDKEDTVVEIGPGKGIVTEALAKRAKRVIAVEIDSDLSSLLKQKLKDFNNIEILTQDALKFDFANSNSRSIKIVSSLPFQITSPLLHKIVLGLEKNTSNPSIVSLLIQKEVALKITAKPPKSSYLANFVKVFGDVSLTRFVDKESFDPAPKVNGAIIVIKKNVQHELAPNIRRFQRFLHHGFSSPRKMLNKVFDTKTLKEANIEATRRAETLSFEEWVRLFSIECQNIKA